MIYVICSMLNTQDFIIFIYDRVYKNAFTYVLHADHLKIQIRISAWLPRFTHITFISRNTLIFKLHQPTKIILHVFTSHPSSSIANRAYSKQAKCDHGVISPLSIRCCRIINGSRCSYAMNLFKLNNMLNTTLVNAM